jgi:hypothetical protein
MLKRRQPPNKAGEAEKKIFPCILPLEDLFNITHIAGTYCSSARRRAALLCSARGSSCEEKWADRDGSASLLLASWSPGAKNSLLASGRDRRRTIFAHDVPFANLAPISFSCSAETDHVYFFFLFFLWSAVISLFRSVSGNVCWFNSRRLLSRGWVICCEDWLLTYYWLFCFVLLFPSSVLGWAQVNITDVRLELVGVTESARDVHWQPAGLNGLWVAGNSGDIWIFWVCVFVLLLRHVIHVPQLLPDLQVDVLVLFVLTADNCWVRLNIRCSLSRQTLENCPGF